MKHETHQYACVLIYYTLLSLIDGQSRSSSFCIDKSISRSRSLQYLFRTQKCMLTFHFLVRCRVRAVITISNSYSQVDVALSIWFLKFCNFVCAHIKWNCLINIRAYQAHSVLYCVARTMRTRNIFKRIPICFIIGCAVLCSFTFFLFHERALKCISCASCFMLRLWNDRIMYTYFDWRQMPLIKQMHQTSI